MPYVYAIVNLTQASVLYIGKGTKKRIRQHSLLIRKGQHHNKSLMRAVKDSWYNKQAVVTTILFEGNDDETYRVEKELISILGRKINNTGCLFNIAPGGSDMVRRTDWELSLTPKEQFLKKELHRERVRRAVKKYWDQKTPDERTKLTNNMRSAITDESQIKRVKTRKRSFSPEQQKARNETHKKTLAGFDWSKSIVKNKESRAEWTEEQKQKNSERCRQAALKRWSKA